jgi:hypothetical protein
MTNNTKVNNLHNLLPKYFKTKQNPNWRALIEAIGESDQYIADLIEEVRKQFFIKTSSRPYIDRLGINVSVSRPRLIGMDDTDFRRYIPILAYQPKQVKIAIDQLLDIFFFKESTTAFIRSNQSEPYALKDGWELSYHLDQNSTENIVFNTADFDDITNASADEIVATINRQATNSFAIVFDDSISKTRSVRLFTKTIGSKGSVEILGGRANIALQFTGFNTIAGNRSNTEWTVTKIGDTVTFQHTGGDLPNINSLQIGDVAIIEIPGNEGSFPIIDIDIASASFTFTNAFATTGVFDHSVLTNAYVKFFTIEKQIVYTKSLRAMTWEVTPGEFIVEMPASPPVVRRKLAGSAHVNGIVNTVINRLSSSSLELDDATDWPTAGGHFVLLPKQQIQMHIKTPTIDEVTTSSFESRFQKQEQYYTYTSIVGNTISGITPALPSVSNIFEATITTAVRDHNGIVTINTSTPHGFQQGEYVGIRDTIPTVDVNPVIDLAVPINGCFEIHSVVNPTRFTYKNFGDEGQATGGVATVERLLMANSGSLAYLTTAQIDTGILGPYIWDLNAPFVLSSLTTQLTTSIAAGNALRSIDVAVNSIPNQEGYLIFGFGTEKEEGPVRYLYKPNSLTLMIDPAYIFEYTHNVGTSVTMIRRRGSHVISGLGTELPFYVTDPTVARSVLQDLIQKVKSAGIFIEFIIRYPEQQYAAWDVFDIIESS